jgi:superfamily II helicase
MIAKLTSLLDLKKELQKNFAELKIDFFPSERRPEWIEVGKEAWGETTIRINLHSDCISMFGIVREKSNSYGARTLPAEAQDYLNEIRTLLETSNLIVVHGPVTVNGSEA